MDRKGSDCSSPSLEMQLGTLIIFLPPAPKQTKAPIFLHPTHSKGQAPDRAGSFAYVK